MKTTKSDFSRGGKHSFRMPEPTSSDPFAQVDWIFQRRMARVPSKEGKANYRAALNFYKRHLIATQVKRPFRLAQEWDKLGLLRLQEDLELPGSEFSQRSSYTRVGYLSSIRQVMKEAAALGILECTEILDVAVSSGGRETDGHESYSDAELAQVLQAVLEERRHLDRVMNGYRPQPPGIGRDPRIRHWRGRAAGFGFGVIENMRWYFEHVLGSSPIVGVGADREKHKRFLLAATNYHGGLHKVYREWGVAAFTDETLLMPLVVELQYLTGLNPSSLLSLRVDCLREQHELTGAPYICFEKKRSGGEKELHLPLLDARDQRALRPRQSMLVANAINAAVRLTSSIREELAAEDPRRDALFIYRSTGPRTFGKIRLLSDQQTSAWCKGMVEKWALRGDDGEALAFNLVRFRSTKLTEMAVEGRDLFEIQQVALHRSLHQTARYIAANRLDLEARRVVAEALERIRKRHLEAREPKCGNQSRPAGAPYKGLISDCDNVFDPPDAIKKLVGYVPRQACVRFNMCLFCPNVIVTRAYLPKLAAYRSQLRAASDETANLPNAKFYEMQLELLDNILLPETSPFTRDDIEWAVRAAELIDEVVDTVVFRGTVQ